MQTITTNELKELFDKRRHFISINLANEAAHKKEHICGSLNITLAELERKAPVILGKDEFIILYSDGPLSSKTKKGASILERLGFKRVTMYTGGLSEWKKSGNCVVGTDLLRKKVA